MKNKKILTIKIEGNNLKGLRGVVDIIHKFIEFEKGVKVKKVSLREMELKKTKK